MAVIWGIHNDNPTLDLVGGGLVSIDWIGTRDMREFGDDKEAIRAHVEEIFPNRKTGMYAASMGCLRRFAFDMVEGDLVISPRKADSTINFGRVAGPYEFHAAEENHRHRRKVEWIRTGVPRTEFSASARYEIGSAITLFQVRRHAEEFLAYLDGGSSPVVPGIDAAEELAVADVPDAERVEESTRDYLVETLYALDPYRFEEFTAALLRAMGYRAETTQATGDGGVDVIAHKDLLGFEPPIIKVQCKRMLGSVGGPEVQKLVGTLAAGGAEVGMFVTLGGYSSDATHMARTRHDLRLVGGPQLVEMILEHYGQLDEEWRREIPLRRVYVVDRG